MVTSSFHPDDSPGVRKARGAFFTPDEVAQFIAGWAITSVTDKVMEPSSGDAAFLVAAVERIRQMSPDPTVVPVVEGIEIHDYSARVGRERVRAAGGRAHVRVTDFFLLDPEQSYDAVIGNPPYVRYQDWSGVARTRSREAALRAGVPLTGLASSWAAFTVHSALFLKAGGRLGLVLPAELLSVNYAAPVRQFLFDNFKSVELVLFDEQIFPEAEADVVLLLADGYQMGPTDHAVIRQANNASELASLGTGKPWAPVDPAGKWTGSLVSTKATDPLRRLLERACCCCTSRPNQRSRTRRRRSSGTGRSGRSWSGCTRSCTSRSPTRPERCRRRPRPTRSTRRCLRAAAAQSV